MCACDDNDDPPNQHTTPTPTPPVNPYIFTTQTSLSRIKTHPLPHSASRSRCPHSSPLSPLLCSARSSLTLTRSAQSFESVSTLFHSVALSTPSISSSPCATDRTSEAFSLPSALSAASSQSAPFHSFGCRSASSGVQPSHGPAPLSLCEAGPFRRHSSSVTSLCRVPASRSGLGTHGLIVLDAHLPSPADHGLESCVSSVHGGTACPPIAQQPHAPHGSCAAPGHQNSSITCDTKYSRGATSCKELPTFEVHQKDGSIEGTSGVVSAPCQGVSSLEVHHFDSRIEDTRGTVTATSTPPEVVWQDSEWKACMALVNDGQRWLAAEARIQSLEVASGLDRSHLAEQFGGQGQGGVEALAQLTAALERRTQLEEALQERAGYTQSSGAPMQARRRLLALMPHVPLRSSCCEDDVSV
jgi:hypothetical protein